MRSWRATQSPSHAANSDSTTMGTRCRNCGNEIRQYNYGIGPEWLHIATPGPYKICKTAPVAEPSETVGEWANKLLRPSGRHRKKEMIDDDEDD